MSKPKLRFKSFDNSYRTCLLNSCLEVTNKRNTKLKYGKKDALSVSDDEGVVNQIQHLGRSYTGADVSNYKILEHNQIVYTKSPLKLKPYGIIKANTGECGIVSVLYAIYNTLEGIDPDYINYYFEPFYRINNYLRPLISKGAKNTINISDESALSGHVTIPSSLDEQKRVSLYFSSLNRYLEITNEKILSLKKIKSACLQSMFPQDGESVPSVRFNAFVEHWKNLSLKDITYKAGIKNKENLPLESFSISNEFGFIPQNEQFENGGTMTNADKRMYYIVSSNTFAYNPARINVGSLGYYSGQKDVIVSSLYEVFKTTDKVNDKFLLYWFKTDIFKKLITQYQEGGVRLYFFYDKLQKCEVKIPSLEEQQKIASFFENLDKQITLQTQRLEKLRLIKSACLDNMFG